MKFLANSFSDCDDAAVLAHFRERKGIHYFPVIADPEEVTLEKLEAVLDNRFELNGELHTVLPGDWTRSPTQDSEWLIVLHKFYYAVGLGRHYHQTGDARFALKWTELTDSWMQAVPMGYLSSDVTGRRIQNWVYAHYYFITACEQSPIDAAFLCRFLASLQTQTEWLRHHLTPARNHRTLELCAIFLVAVVFPELRGASEWLAFAIDALLENMRTDLQPDGVQCELSTDYHHIVLRNYLVVRRLAERNAIALPAEMDQHIRRALEFAKWVHRPDGLIPSLSDGDSGCFLDLLEQGHELYGDEEMLYVATAGTRGRAPLQEARVFEHAGYSILRSGWGAGRDRFRDERYLVFDCGPLGAGNHGHLDFLSFEAYAYGRALIVDPGRYTYDESGPENWRALFRGTRYHNTVSVDSRNQIRYEFDRTRHKITGMHPVLVMGSFAPGSEIHCLQAVCRSAEYPAVHERRIVFVRGEYWIVSDLLSAGEIHDYDAWFHLSAEAHGHTRLSECRVDAPNLVIAWPSSLAAGVALEEGFVSPRYGIRLSAPIVRVHRRSANAVFHTVLLPYREGRPQIEVKSQGAKQIRITIKRSGERQFQDVVRFDENGRPCFERLSVPGPQHDEALIER